jgi:predicted RND superfamily exporter protein
VVTVTLAAMAATGIPLSPVTATLAALSIGIAVPFTIHVTNRYLEKREREGGPPSAVRRTLAGTGTALTASAATTAIGFGVLTTSSLLPFRQLGQVTLYASGAALAAAILVLPSLLALWERRQPTPTDHDASPKPEPAHAG